MNRWLARLAMSFMIITVVLAWSGYQALQHNADLWRPIMDLFAAAASLTLGVQGMRIRHAEIRKIEQKLPTKGHQDTRRDL